MLVMGSIGLTGTGMSAHQQKQQHQGAQCAQTPSFGLSTRVTSSNDANKTKHRYPDVHDILLIGGTSHPRLNQGVSEALGVELGKVREYWMFWIYVTMHCHDGRPVLSPPPAHLLRIPSISLR